MPTIPFIGSFFSSSSSTIPESDYRVQKTEEEWRTILNKEQFRVLREKGTEMEDTGEYNKHYPSSGVYACVGCGAPLYRASHKFNSGCGWPAFFDAIPGAIKPQDDNSMGMKRTEIVCKNCGGHLGHVFEGEGHNTPTDQRHCVNSVSIKFSPDESKADGKGDVETNGESKV
ncbi:peptide methionine sulfoxide reductase msrB [Glonium stellatum]|uniref:Peptide-methionine (R)-S-oxide reductase n=1 Tax=Glonium stellatum TaxID=574774 RepID=A0A8E2FA37_9PEZI|nr:peptide methionine sulfoxide reductase msrB [Glonium stellatum]